VINDLCRRWPMFDFTSCIDVGRAQPARIETKSDAIRVGVLIPSEAAHQNEMMPPHRNGNNAARGFLTAPSPSAGLLVRNRVLFGAAVAGLAVSLAGCQPVGYGYVAPVYADGYYGGYAVPAYAGGHYGVGYYGGAYRHGVYREGSREETHLLTRRSHRMDIGAGLDRALARHCAIVAL
jgi:hypothetical protein